MKYNYLHGISQKEYNHVIEDIQESSTENLRKLILFSGTCWYFCLILKELNKRGTK